MREIKFRAWDTHLNKMIPEKDGFYLGSVYSEIMGGDEYPLMQYTGLKDKNGREIYEGDIVTAWRPRPRHLPKDPFKKIQVTGNVVYEPPAFFLIIGVYDDRNWIEFEHNAEPYEIIGNIYENLELLNK